MNKYIKELIKICNENPDLPVKTFTHYEVVGEDCSSWMGEIYQIKIEEVIEANDRYYFGYDDFYDEYLSYEEDEDEILKYYNKAEKAKTICIMIGV